jgi:hypothetical protein
MFTGKQERNGTDVGVGSENTAQPGPDFAGAMSAAQAKAESAATEWKSAGEAIFLGGPAAAAGNFTAGGDMWEWDSGLAVAEQPGEA